jgi:hypothetical protein
MPKFHREAATSPLATGETALMAVNSGAFRFLRKQASQEGDLFRAVPKQARLLANSARTSSKQAAMRKVASELISNYENERSTANLR